ncbi:MAG: 4-hydroxy-tetrahydrodipicolinate synthase [Clostridiales bacterium]|nr:4-hydroxy-tetrahydrodipicolinate synthase [Clostridiales bacterium]
MRKSTIFTGSATALITPFTKDGVDFEAFKRLIDFQIENGTDALVVCGTTGEPATMTYEERASVVKFAIDYINKRVPVIVGTGSNATHIAVSNSKVAYEAGADALLVVTPYYNKCTQEGLFRHFEAVCSATPLPVICYSVPGRTGVNITPETLERLATLETMTAIKEASGSMDQITDICARVKDKLDVYSGDDGLILPILSVGGKGVISVASNIVPNEVHNLCQNFFDGKINDATDMQLKLYPLVKALFCEVNPIPVKTAASLMGFGECNLRLPLCNMSDKNLEYLKNEIKKFGIQF